jgi:antitoxin VapB
MDIQIFKGVVMPLYIRDDVTAGLVAELAKQRGITKQDAVRLAVTAELERAKEAVPLRERFAALRAAHPLPPPTGLLADKAFFDDLSGEP